MNTQTEAVPARTKGPWRVRSNFSIEIVSANDEHIAQMGRFADDEKDNEAHANATFIVRAVNAHDDLLSACVRALSIIDFHADHISKQVHPNEINQLLTRLKAAISKSQP